MGDPVYAEAVQLRRDRQPREAIADPAPRGRFLRIACPAPDWIELKSAAGVGVSRYVGVVVEAAVNRASQSSP